MRPFIGPGAGVPLAPVMKLAGTPRLLNQGGGGLVARSDNPHLSAYYMLALIGNGSTVEDFILDIQMMRDMGLESAGLEFGAWSTDDGPTAYQPRMANMFEAAEREGSGFKLYHVWGMGANLSVADMEDALDTYGAHPNYLQVNGKPFLMPYGGHFGNGGTTTADGQDFWQDDIANSSIDASLFPGFYAPKAIGGELDSDNPSYDELRAYYDGWWGDPPLDGLAALQLTGTATTVPASMEAYDRLHREENKYFVAMLHSMYFINRISASPVHRFIMENFGGELIAAQFQSFIYNQSRSFIGVVGPVNDKGEDYLLPIAPGDWSSVDYPTLHSHVAFAKLIRYYTRWVRERAQPQITRFELFGFNRTHSKSLIASADPGDTFDLNDLEDVICATAFIPVGFTGTVRITTGGVDYDHAVGPGITHVRQAFATGAVRYRLIVSAATVIDLAGESIVASITNYNFSPATVYGSAAASGFDTTPSGLTFSAATDVELETLVESAPVVVAGINCRVEVSITGGQYSKNGGAFTGNLGYVEVGDTLVVRGLSATSYDTEVTPEITVGTVSADFSITTEADPTPAWLPEALYDFVWKTGGAVPQSGRDEVLATGVSFPFTGYFGYVNGAPRTDATGLLFDDVTHFDRVYAGGDLAALTSGDDVCVLIELAPGMGNQDVFMGASGGGHEELHRDGPTSLGSWNGANFLNVALGGGKSFDTDVVRVMIRQTAAGRRICAAGGSVASDANKINAARPLYFGGNGTNGNLLNGAIRRIAFFNPATISDADMQALTTGQTA